MLFYQRMSNYWSCVHDCIGAVKSGLQSHWPGLFGHLLRLSALILFRDARQGAQTVIYCALVSDKTAVDQLSGKLVVDCRGVDVVQVARKYRDAERLWAVVSQICQLDDARTMATELPAAVTAHWWDQFCHRPPVNPVVYTRAIVLLGYFVKQL